MSNVKTLTIKFDSVSTAASFMDDIDDLIYWNDREKDPDDRRYEASDNSSQIGFSWDGETFTSCDDAVRHIRQERYGF